MRKVSLVALYMFVFVSLLTAQTPNEVIVKGYGGLYVMHNEDESIRIVSEQSDGSVLDTTVYVDYNDLKLHYYAADKDTDVDFEFQLHERIKNSWKQDVSDKTLVVSDLHGELDAFVAILKGNGVVDDNLNWIYGKNQLVFIGDIFDRGRDDNGIAWLVYKLEKEAEEAGGHINFVLGNHEDLVLKDDLRYVHEDHFVFSSKAGIPYAELYSVDTELGRWLRDSYLIVTVGSDLFVHGGLSSEMVDKSYKIGEINELGWRFIGIPNKERNELHSRNERLFGNSGPIWYRGLAADSERRPGISSEDLDNVLKYYKADRIIVGHTRVEEIDWRYDGRVIAVNVRHHRNFEPNRTAALLIENGKYYSVNYTGDRELLSK